MKNSEFAGIILAGGNSTRMGKNKYDLKIDKQTLLDRTIKLLDPFVSQIIIVLKQSEIKNHRVFDNRKTIVTYDSVSNQGPLQGIADGSKCAHSNINHILLLTCDLPYLTVEWLSLLKDSYLAQKVDGVITCADNFTNPLIAVYKKNVLKRAQSLINNGYKRPIDLWEGFNILPVNINEDESRTVQDMNTPEAYEEARHFYDEQD